MKRAIAALLLAGCSANLAPAGAPAGARAGAPAIVPVWSSPASLVTGRRGALRRLRIVQREATPFQRKGLYASEFSGDDVYGYPYNDENNSPNTCTLSGVSNVNDVAVDSARNLIVPNGGNHTIRVYKGPQRCGALAATVKDPYGQPADAAGPNALTGNFVVANIFDNKGAAGSLSICHVSKKKGTCTVNLTNPNMYQVGGVAMDTAGDCWADALAAGSGTNLIYFASCSGAGVVATGFENADLGGLDIDSAGNLVSISATDGNVYVYSGCNPACTLVGGPFPLNNLAVFGHLNKQSNQLAVASYVEGGIDVYSYTPAGITYLYSVTTGLEPALDVEGAAYSPRSPE
jgi:hypothetical protein